TTGYDYDTFCADLDALMQKLDLHHATLIGHSMGTGEVTRYIARHGSERVDRGVLVSAIPPFLLKTDDNPEGLPGELSDGFEKAAEADTPAWMAGFLNGFYNYDILKGKLVSQEAWNASWNLAVSMSAVGAVQCIPTWLTDFRDDISKIELPI